MGNKTHQEGFRLDFKRNWISVSCPSKKSTPEVIRKDWLIREFLKKKLHNAGLSEIIIERSVERIRVTIILAKPAFAIGRRGQELESLTKELIKIDNKQFVIDVKELKGIESDAQWIATNLAALIRRRMPYRRAMKRAVQTAMNSSGVKGIYISCSGRLNGADIARTDSQRLGSVPRHTLKENIRYGFAESHTTYGVIGVSVLVCKEQSY